ncbi:isotrichodermin C-15 hydroxylase [Colletotrichum plurivorum]|uniref:Isotrichodermin C-15 hydroxylase n=1 Tax=Colletotrichum plurivorum TaxID=2175906 RepID=A0A8H6K4V0_9PEZI|nr:isotrichodermin C-15 hydroxylase [Colletotrichum plurivorum]
MAFSLLREPVSAVPTAWLLCGLALSAFAAYVVYQRYFHPLAAYPGPFWASITDLWQVNQFLSLRQPYNLTELHEKYGEFVRYGPDKLSITAEEVVPLVYQKGGRRLPKTEFYDAFGNSKTPNVFSMRDVEGHSLRRRHMLHSFSISSVKGMEPYMDRNIEILRAKISALAEQDETFDLKKLLQFYVIDVLGELAFSRSFGAQASGDESRIPPVVPHTLLGSTIGAWPLMTATLKKWLPVVPTRAFKVLFEGRTKCARLAAECVQQRLDELERVTDEKDQRTDILTNLIMARDPETGKRLSRPELEAEAFGMIVAGTHTTSATTTLLFWNLLHSPETLQKCVEEVERSLEPLDAYKKAYSFADVERALPYLRACVKENFRQTPMFTMPLARRVTAPEGIVVAGRHIKQGTSVAVCNHAFHHNPAVWGDDHDIYDPSRWDSHAMADRSRYLMHLGLGNRQCLGKTVALANIYKLASTLLRDFEFQLADPEESEKAARGEFRGKLPGLISVGVSDLRGPLMVRAKTTV